MKTKKKIYILVAGKDAPNAALAIAKMGGHIQAVHNADDFMFIIDTHKTDDEFQMYLTSISYAIGRTNALILEPIKVKIVD